MITPLHIGTVGGKPLRFFRTPLNDGLPDGPWVAVDDVGHCLALNREHRRMHQRVMQSTCKDVIHTLSTPDGLVSIVPHAMMRAAVEALIDTGRVPASARDEYVHASAEAMMKLNPGCPSPEALTAWTNAVVNRWSGSERSVSFSMDELLPHMTVKTSDGVERAVEAGDVEREYLLTEGQVWLLALLATPEDGAKNANEIKHEVVKVLMAWRRGKLLPRWEVPLLAGICDDLKTPDVP
jgi:hypothetical protein